MRELARERRGGGGALQGARGIEPTPLHVHADQINRGGKTPSPELGRGARSEKTKAEARE